MSTFVRSKIVATVGPASSDAVMLGKLIQAGVSVFRINTAHGDRAEHQQTLDRIRAVAEQLASPVAVLVDLAGPKIRLGTLLQDPLVCALNSELTFVRGDRAEIATELTANYQQLIDDASVGDQILLADGIVRLEVIAKSTDRLQCKVLDGGEIRSRQGIALPGVRLSLTALLPKDLDNARWAAKNQVDFISLSFVTSADELNVLRKLIGDQHSQAAIVAKIEKREALENLDEIIQAADVIMVARGDLGVEIAIESTPIAQKRIIRRCRDFYRPVIVATQMLDSMQHSSYPTRAEVSDVANAILDGADACMLSGETAIGEFPCETVSMMRRILAETESIMSDRVPVIRHSDQIDESLVVTRAVVFGAAHIADQIDAKLMVIGTNTGVAARLRSKLRDAVPTLALCNDPLKLRQLCMLWGILPMTATNIDLASTLDLQNFIQQLDHQQMGLQPRDRVVYVSNTDLREGFHDQVLIGEIR
jgi:pyruvate kinase